MNEELQSKKSESGERERKRERNILLDSHKLFERPHDFERENHVLSIYAYDENAVGALFGRLVRWKGDY